MNATTNQAHGEIIAAGTVRFTRVLPGPIERVWAYITESEKRGRWFASGEWRLEPGGGADLHFLHADLTPHDEAIPEQYKAMETGASFSGRVSRCEPPHLVSITWPESWGESEVTFELSERDDGKVLLTLTHSRLTEAGLRETGPGWHVHLRILEDRLNGREPAPFWPDIVRYQAEYAEHLGNSRD